MSKRESLWLSDKNSDLKLDSRPDMVLLTEIQEVFFAIPLDFPTEINSQTLIEMYRLLLAAGGDAYDLRNPVRTGLMIKRTQGDPASADLGSVLAARVAFEFPTLEKPEEKSGSRNRGLARKKAIQRESIELQNKIKALIFLLRVWKTRYEQKNMPSTLSTVSEWNAGIHLRLSNKFDPKNLVLALYAMLSQTLSKDRQLQLTCVTSSSGDHTLSYGGVELMSIVKPPRLDQRFIKMDDKSTGQTVFIKKVGTPRKRTINNVEIGLDEYVFDHDSNMVKRYMIRALTPQERTLIYEYVQNGKQPGQGLGSPAAAPYQRQPFHSSGLKTFFEVCGSYKFYQILKDPHVRAAFVTLFNTRDYICASGLMVNTANLSAEGKSFVQSTENFFPYRRWNKSGALPGVTVQGGGFVVIDLSKVRKDSIYGLGTIDSFAYASYIGPTGYRVFDNRYLSRLRTLAYGNRETQFSALPFDALIAFSKNEGVDFSSIDEVKAPYLHHRFQGNAQLTSTLIMQLEGELPIVYPTVTVPSPLPRLSIVSARALAVSSLSSTVPSSSSRTLVLSASPSTVPSPSPRALVASSSLSTVPSPSPRSSPVSLSSDDSLPSPRSSVASLPSTDPSPSPGTSVASLLSDDPSPLPRASVASLSSANPSPSPRTAVASLSSADLSPSTRTLFATLSSTDLSPSPSALVASLSSVDPLPSLGASVASLSSADPSPSPRTAVASLSSADLSPSTRTLFATLSSTDLSPSPSALVASLSSVDPLPSLGASVASLSSADPSPSPRTAVASLSSANLSPSTRTLFATLSSTDLSPSPSALVASLSSADSLSSTKTTVAPTPSWASRVAVSSPRSSQPVLRSSVPTSAVRASTPAPVSTPNTSSGASAFFPRRQFNYHKSKRIADQKRAQERAPRLSVFGSTSPANKTIPNSSSNPLITVTSS